MRKVSLLSKLPCTSRNVGARAEAKTDDIINISRQFGKLYFDGPRAYGYGGYRYDGRWIPAAADIVNHFGLKKGNRVLDVGCAKGFLVKDLMMVCPGIEAFGIDVSEYALYNCEPEVVGRLHLGNATRLPFPSESFDAVVSINTLHNLPRGELIMALREIERLAPGKGFIQVDSYRTPEQKDLFENWILTAKFHGYPEAWIKLFHAAGYTGDYDWTIVE